MLDAGCWVIEVGNWKLARTERSLGGLPTTNYTLLTTHYLSH